MVQRDTILIPSIDGGDYRRWLVDGALATNDPSLCAITESLASTPTEPPQSMA